MPKQVSAKGEEKRWLRLQLLEPGVRLSVLGRVAYLEGYVSRYERKKELTRLAAGLSSVAKVVNRLRVVPGSPRADGAIEEAVLVALKIAPILSSESISVKVTDGVVELTGMVPDISARVAVEAAAWSTWGVQHVDNRLELRSWVGPETVELGRDLKRGLNSTLGPWAGQIDLEVKQGVVHLRGEVPSAEDRLAAEDWFRWHPMVRQVVDDLSVPEEPLSSFDRSA